MSDNLQPKSPDDCLRQCRRLFSQEQYKHVSAMIEVYALTKVMNFINGGWIEEVVVRNNLKGDHARIAMIIQEGLNFLYGWLAKEEMPDERAHAVAMMIAQQAWDHYNVPLELALASLISRADEKTIATALMNGRAAREKPPEQRSGFLRLVYSAPDDATSKP